MIIESEFIKKIKVDYSTEECSYAPPCIKHQYETGSYDCGPWCLIENYEVTAHRACMKPCPHAHTPHIHIYERYDKSVWEERAWIIPRVVTVYLEEYGDETTATCLDCILNALIIKVE